MIAALMLMAMLAIIAVSVLSLSAADRRRAIRQTRSEVRESCAYSGLNYARTYFANRFPQWNTFLANPGQFNPIGTGGVLPTPTTPGWGAAVPASIKGATPAATAAALNALQVLQPNLFIDLDNDGVEDVYIFIRDNMDELNQTPNNYQRDNDQNVIVGAICVSLTMQPKREDGTVDTDRLMVESMLSYNEEGTTNPQSLADGNLNTNAIHP